MTRAGGRSARSCRCRSRTPAAPPIWSRSDGTSPRPAGPGYATEAAQAVLDRAAAAGIQEVLALTDLDNEPSQRVALRLGMEDEGVTDRWFGLTTRQYRKVWSPWA